MPDMDGITATREMTMQVPYCQIVIISVQFEMDYMRSAMLAGARDYQTKPFSADELVNCIRRVYDAAKPQYRRIEEAQRAPEVAIIDAVKPTGATAPFFLVYSPKGGTGKSAMAINLAAALEREHPGVSLIDANLQWGDLPIWLGLRPAKTLADFVETGIPDADLLPQVLVEHSSGVKLLSAPPKPEFAELISGNMLIQAARQVRERSSAVVLDTASYLSDHTLALMDISSVVLLVVTPDLPSVKNIRIFRDMAPILGLKTDQLMLIINRANRFGALPAEQIAKALNMPRFFAVPEDPKLRLALLKAQSIFELDANAPSAVALTQAATAIWQWVREPKPAAVEEPSAKVVS
jgi:pilus assembly protein CpaE